jgi:hypothetical protein
MYVKRDYYDERKKKKSRKNLVTPRNVDKQYELNDVVGVLFELSNKLDKLEMLCNDIKREISVIKSNKTVARGGAGRRRNKTKGPKQPLNAYMLYCQDNRDNVKQDMIKRFPKDVVTDSNGKQKISVALFGKDGRPILNADGTQKRGTVTTELARIWREDLSKEEKDSYKARAKKERDEWNKKYKKKVDEEHDDDEQETPDEPKEDVSGEKEQMTSGGKKSDKQNAISDRLRKIVNRGKK